ncbi:hypothetical protein ECEC1846_2218, partial [Escherichia coli EC1846]
RELRIFSTTVLP